MMKRTKVNHRVVPATILHHERNFEKGNSGKTNDDKGLNDASGIRMLENLNIALFFSRAQSKMGEQK